MTLFWTEIRSVLAVLLQLYFFPLSSGLHLDIFPSPSLTACIFMMRSVLLQYCVQQYHRISFLSEVNYFLLHSDYSLHRSWQSIVNDTIIVKINSNENQYLSQASVCKPELVTSARYPSIIQRFVHPRCTYSRCSCSGQKW